VFDVSPTDPNRSIEITSVNYISCTSLGEINGYRQLFESETARFLGTPELTMSGVWDGAKITSSLVRGISDITSLFKAGTGFVLNSRFITDINADLPTTGAFFDFSESNITNDESMIFNGAYITRNGAINPTDTAIHPNMDADSVKSRWKSNTGISNTNQYLNAYCTTEVETVISTIDTYYALLGTMTVNESAHFDMPSNGEYRFLTSYGTFNVNANLTIEGSSGDEIDIRVTKSSDDGVTWPDEVNHISRIINSFAGSRDVAFFTLSFLVTLSKNERLRVEVENKSGTGNVTMELDSYFIISEV